MAGSKNPRVLITGAGGGIAAAIISHFATAGARLALAGRRLEQVCERARPVDAVALAADLTDPDETSRMVEDAAARLGGLDVLIHTVGGFETAAATDFETQRYEKLFDRNVRSLVHTASAALPLLLKQERSFLAAFSAAPGWRRSGGAGMSLYGAAKAAVAAYLHALRDELGAEGLAVAVVYPLGVVETSANREAMPGADRSSWIDPQEIAEALLNAAASGPRGQLLELPVFPAASS